MTKRQAHRLHNLQAQTDHPIKVTADDGEADAQSMIVRFSFPPGLTVQIGRNGDVVKTWIERDAVDAVDAVERTTDQ